jgi:hypothetical protein
MRRFWLALVIIGLIGVAPAVLYYLWLAQHVKPSKDMQAFDYALDDTTYHDVVFLGASKVEVNIDPRVIDSLTGFNSYDLTVDGMGVLEYTALLKAYLQHHRAPKYVLISTDHGLFNTHRTLYNAVDFFPYAERDTSIGNLLARYNPLYRDRLLQWKLRVQKVTATTDAARYQAMFPNTAPSVNPQDQWPYYKGFRAVTLNWQESREVNSRKRMMVWREEGFELLDQLVELCRAYGAEPIFFFAAEYESTKDLYENGDEIMQRIAEVATRNNVPFWNYEDHPISTDKRYYYNPTHLNLTGAKIFSAVVASDINEKAHNRR